ncbi:MAG: helix-turn-helix domain-containing protein [Planctomycetota bacterium]
MTTQPITTPEEIKARLTAVALELSVSPLSPRLRDTVGAVRGAVWPHDIDDGLIGLLQDQLFIVTHRASLGDGPLRQVARDIRTLTEALIPTEPPEAPALEDDDGSPVLTPDEAARYLGLDKLGVTKSADRVRYLVKKGRLRSIKVLGRTAFQRCDLDEYLVRHASPSGGR